MNRNSKSCLHCGRCTHRCPFLQKHHIDLAGLEARPDLAGHCFLCGECRRVCPVGLDGRSIVLDQRSRLAAAGRSPLGDRLSLGSLTLRTALFRSGRRGRGTSALFPGCNFPAYYPGTMAHLTRLAAAAGVGVLYDCCGKPAAELGFAGAEAAVLARIDRQMDRLGVSELVTLCPNCYYFLRGRVPGKVRSIYDKLAQWGIETRDLDLSDSRVFLPCPDRDTKELLTGIERLLPQSSIRALEGGPCCGLGGGAGRREPLLARGMAESLAGAGKVYTYCASCAGRISGGGGDARHLLCWLLGQPERPAAGLPAQYHRLSCRFRGRRAP